MVFYSHTNSLRRDYDMKIYLCNKSVRELQKQKDYRSLFAAEDKVSYMVNRKMKQFFLKDIIYMETCGHGTMVHTIHGILPDKLLFDPGHSGIDGSNRLHSLWQELFCSSEIHRRCDKTKDCRKGR